MSPLATPWSAHLDVKIDVGVGIYAGHGAVAAKWQPATPDADWQPGASPAHWGGGGGAASVDDVVWRDVTCDTELLSTFRGSSGFSHTVDVGTARFTLRNESGQYTTQLEHNELAVPMRIGRRVRIQLRPADLTMPWYSGFYGQITSIDERVAPDGSDTIEVTAADWFSYLARIDPAQHPPGTADETDGRRVSYWLDSIAWPTTMYLVEAGFVPLNLPTEPATSVLDELRRVAASAGGTLYCAESGSLLYRARGWDAIHPRSNTVQAVLWASPQPPPLAGDVPVRAVVCPYAVEFDYSIERVTNRVTFGTEGGASVTDQDDASIDLHGFRDDGDTSLLTRDTADLDLLVAEHLARRGTARRRVTSATMTVKEPADAYWAVDTLLFDRVKIHYEQPGSGWSSDTEAHIYGIEWRIDRVYADFIIHTDDVLGA